MSPFDGAPGAPGLIETTASAERWREAVLAGAGEDEGDRAVALVLELGQALHRAGYSANVLEEVLSGVSARLGLAGQFFSTPTSLFVGFGRGAAQRTYMLRVEPGGVDLGRLAALDALTTRFLDGEVEAPAALAELRALAAGPNVAGVAATLGGFALAAGSSAIFLGGGLPEVAAAGALGIAIGALAFRARSAPRLGRVFEPLAATLAAGLVTLACGLSLPLAASLATLAALVPLLPGFSLTVALSELATRHLASGTARLAGALVTFLSLGFGVALGERLALLLVPERAAAAPDALPLASHALAIAGAAVGYVVVLRARRADLGWIALATLAAAGGARLGNAWLGPQLGPMLGSFVVAAGSNLLALLRRRPAAVTLVPGLFTLVPGSIGFRSMASLLEKQTLMAVDIGFEMAVVAVAIVTGVLLANVVVPARRRSARGGVQSAP